MNDKTPFAERVARYMRDDRGKAPQTPEDAMLTTGYVRHGDGTRTGSDFTPMSESGADLAAAKQKESHDDAPRGRKAATTPQGRPEAAGRDRQG